NSTGVKLSSLRNNGKYFPSPAFPTHSPPQPAYPTGHRTIGGASPTVLKVHFDGSAPIVNPLVPSANGSMVMPYNDSASGLMTANGELHKLAHNISLGHGILPGIHWRSDTDYSLILGEAVALKFLQDQAWTYDENIDITLTKLDGTPTTISNH